MELKTNYQYTYFIHPFVIKEGKYQKYILKMLRDKDFKLKTFQKEKDLKLYQYFLPKTREFLFSSFSFGNSKLKKLEELPEETKAAIISKYPCNIFEYRIKKDIQGKVDDKKGIFFTISKIEIICFETGICFLVIKTNIELGQNSFRSPTRGFSAKAAVIQFGTNYHFIEVVQRVNSKPRSTHVCLGEDREGLDTSVGLLQ